MEIGTVVVLDEQMIKSTAVARKGLQCFAPDKPMKHGEQGLSLG